MIREKLVTTHKHRKSRMGKRYGFLKFFIKFLVLLVCIAGVVDTQEDDHVAIIYKINGTLQFRASAGDNWETAKQMAPLYNGNQLRTETGNKAIIVYNTGTRVLLNENTTIEIQAEVETAGGKPQVERTRLILGEIYNRAKGNYEVETPSSVASVRGTEFDVITGEETDTYVGIEGIIEIMNAFGSIVLEQLQMTTVARDGAPKEPTTITEDEAGAITEWTGEVEPTWRLNLVPEHGTEQQLGGVFTLSIQALKEGALDPNATFALTEFSSDSGTIEFSTNNGKTWSGEPPQITILNGMAVITCRITEEATVNITAKAEDAETALMSITSTRPKEKKILEMLFMNPDGGGERTLIWELEER